MTLRGLGIGFATLAGALLHLSSFALAATLTLDGQVQAGARTASGFNLIDSDSEHLIGGPVPGSVSDFRTAHANSSYSLGPSVADALYEGEARFGTLRGRAEAGAIAGTAFAQLVVGWDDDFRVTSGTLPFGTPVHLRFSLFLESGVFSNQSCDGVSPPGPAIAQAIGRHGAAGIVSNRACGPAEPQSVVTLIPTTVGALIEMSGELNVGASVGSSAATRPHNIASADAFNTAHFYVDPVESDFSYITTSGVTYFSPVVTPPISVPQPGAWLLLGTAAALFGYARRRRARETRACASEARRSSNAPIPRVPSALA